MTPHASRHARLRSMIPAIMQTPGTQTPAQSLARSEAGATIVEFALVAPVFLLLLFSGLNLAQMAYGQALLNGAVQDAARSSTLETANTAVADGKVRAIVNRVLPGVTVTGTRRSYYDFTDIGRPERWNDRNSNGRCDTGETYTDENRNGTWDSDIGVRGNGTANDVILYTVTATYRPLFPLLVPPYRGHSNTTIQSVTVRKNQPFTNQLRYATVAAVC